MSIKTSKRADKISKSPIRAVFDLAAGNKGEYINLAIGQPHFDVPSMLKTSTIRAIEEGSNSYEQSIGNIGLRKKIAEKLKNKNFINADYNNIIITSGVSGGIFLALSSIIDENDEVIISDPLFGMYKQILNFLGAKIIIHNTYPEFRLKAEKLKKLISKKTKLIIINSPNNPTGMVYDKNELCKLAEIADKFNTPVLSDEIYEKFDYKNKFFSIGSIYENTITLNGFSKSHSITGWRLGYAHAPAEIIEAMVKIQQYTFVCAPSLAQKAMINNININLSRNIAQYKKNSQLVFKEMRNNFDLIEGEGAFYAFIKIPNKNFIKKAIEKKVLIVPGSAFSVRNTHFRLSFAAKTEDLKKGLDILNSL
jgi:aspartate/methionine/tyrosine aminotransferase